MGLFFLIIFSKKYINYYEVLDECNVKGGEFDIIIIIS